MIVTINTDASFHPKYKEAAYAFWIVCNQGRIMHSGVLKKASNPTDAELQCICNALHVLLKSEYTEVTKIIINSDALYAFNKVGRKRQGTGRVCAELLRKLKKKYQSGKNFNFPLHEFRHVKAHSGTETKRKYVNNWCDQEAKGQLRRHITNIKANEKVVS